MVLLNEKSKRNVYVIILRVKTNDNNTICTHTYIFMAMKKRVEKGVERAMNIRFSLFHR